ncbi:MAG: MGMT family protein [Patescibacteria group bacterium]
MIKHLIFRAVSYIPSGKVLTYGTAARLAGVKSPRLIGNVLHQNTDPKKNPCHRVVNAQGGLALNYAFGGEAEQRRKLQSEGISFIRQKVNLSKHLWKPHRLLCLFFKLLRRYGEPGPWPWFDALSPHSKEEIAIGAILTQNVSWRNVEQAMENLRGEKANTLDGIYRLFTKDQQKLKKLIKPAGFYNQKALYLWEFTKFIILNFKSLTAFFKLPLDEARLQLLAVRGIGPETADTILLYSGEKPIFIIDAYTKKLVKHYRFKKSNLTYQVLQDFFAFNLPKNVRLYQDYHALIVKKGKERG